MSFKNLNKIILALFLAVFAINVSFAGEITPMMHDSNSSLGGTTTWVQNNSYTNITVAFTNNLGSTHNITDIYFSFSGSYNEINIRDAWCPNNFSTTIGVSENSLQCSTSTAVIQKGETVNVTFYILATYASGTNPIPLNVQTTDNNGELQNTSYSFKIGTDVYAPTLSISPASPIGNKNETFNVTITESEVKVDNSTNSTAVHVLTTGDVCGSLYSPNIICNAAQTLCYYSFVMDASNGDGPCSVTVSFNDTFNNTNTTTKTYTVDNRGPVISLVSDLELRNGTPIRFSITDTPAEVSSAWWLNGSANETMPNVSSIYSIDTTGWSEGVHIIQVWANDTLGNIADNITSGGVNHTTITITIDDSAPNVTITKPVPSYYGDSVFVNVTVSDDNKVTSVNATMNGTFPLSNTAGNFWTGTITTTLFSGILTLNVNASDLAGNVNNTEYVSNVAFDHTNPTIISLTAPASFDIIYERASFTVTANVSDLGGSGVKNCAVYADGYFAGNVSYNATTSECSGSVNMPYEVSAGNKVVDVYVYDNAGNKVSASVTITVKSSGSTTSGGSVSSLGFNITMPKVNHKPTLSAPTVDNEAPNKGAIINCVSGTFSDVDGDSKLGEQWKWFVNSIQVSGSSSSFDTNQANVGDKITCSQRATDGINYTDWTDSSNSATVQNAEKPTAGTAVGATGNDNPSNPLTGAFIGSLLKDNIFLTIVAVVVMGGSIAVLTIRFIKRRGLKVKVE